MIKHYTQSGGNESSRVVPGRTREFLENNFMVNVHALLQLDELLVITR